MIFVQKLSNRIIIKETADVDFIHIEKIAVVSRVKMTTIVVRNHQIRIAIDRIVVSPVIFSQKINKACWTVVFSCRRGKQ